MPGVSASALVQAWLFDPIQSEETTGVRTVMRTSKLLFFNFARVTTFTGSGEPAI